MTHKPLPATLCISTVEATLPDDVTIQQAREDRPAFLSIPNVDLRADR